MQRQRRASYFTLETTAMAASLPCLPHAHAPAPDSNPAAGNISLEFQADVSE